jgi:tRNA-guanine transglycosylase
MSRFKIIAKEKMMRAGVLETAHGFVETPIFMPVGTQATVKAISPDDLKEANAQIILGNTYHLFLRPGSQLIRKMGGLHKFMGWDGPILTDSGGFQAFSLGAMIGHGVRKVPAQTKTSRDPKERYSDEGLQLMQARDSGGVEKGSNVRNTMGGIKNDIVSYSSVKNVVDKREKSSTGREVVLNKQGWDQYENPERTILSKITEEGVHFTSHIDGSKHLLTPETSIEVQFDLGSDIVLVLDELLSPLHSPIYAKESLARTHRWEKRSKEYFDKNKKTSLNPSPLLFGIVQGVYDKKIRETEAKWVADQGFDGFSIGGSFGTSEYWGGEKTDWAASKAIYETVGWVTPLLPEDLPRHILGIGEVEDFFECIERGADMFDCVAPTRRARNGSLYISPKNGGKKANKFTINISRAKFKEDPSPIDKNCKCYTCQNFTRSYLRHLFMSGELLYHRLATIHNVYFCVNLTKQIRESIIKGEFNKLKKKWLKDT